MTDEEILGLAASAGLDRCMPTDAEVGRLRVFADLIATAEREVREGVRRPNEAMESAGLG